MTFQIPYARQEIDETDLQAVRDVLTSNWLTQGPVITEFEQQCAKYVKAKYAIAVSNATSALHLACLALDLGPGDILWTSPNTFVASSNCALYCGAKVDFVDIDAKTYNIGVDALKEKLQLASKTHQLPKVLVVVHFAGQSCQMKEIKQLADHYGVKIIEDASHAIGGKYLNHYVGSGEFSDAVVFSFHPVKIITTGEGGMVLTNNEQIKDKVQLLRSHGITRDEKQMQGASEGPWYYQQIDLGFNYRITDIQAALGLNQLKRIDTFIQRRNILANQYHELLADLPVITPWQSQDCLNAFHLYTIQLKLSEIKHTRREVFESLRKAGIGVNVHYIPVHTQPYYQKLGFKQGDFPVAEAYYAQAISLPMFYGLKDEEQQYVVASLKKIF